MSLNLRDPLLVRLKDATGEETTMTTMTTVSEPAGLERSASARIRRTPLYFESRGAWLFGWLHQGESSSRCQRGVIICAPPGYEQIHSHRSLRHLADALAEAGFPVMRFDLHGTGDSDGVDEDADRHATWMANLRSAIDWMRGELGCAEVSVIGIRLGATLAAQVAAAEAVADLVLWAPVVKGRAYVRDMRFLSKTAGVPVDGSQGLRGGWIRDDQADGRRPGWNRPHADSATVPQGARGRSR